MKAKISNIEVTGTPAEIAELIWIQNTNYKTEIVVDDPLKEKDPLKPEQKDPNLRYGMGMPNSNPNIKTPLSPDFARGLTNNQE
jgi:hypothetical protein